MKNLLFTFILITLALAVYAQKNNTGDSLKDSKIIIPENHSSYAIPKDSVSQFLLKVIDSLKASRGKFEKFVFDAKAEINKKGVHEQLWVLLIDYEDEQFVGILIQQPALLKNLTSGQQVRFKKDPVKEIIIKNVKTGIQTNYSLEQN